MCGIFGYLGEQDPLTECLSGLALLEYRGYDSTGIAGISEGKILFCKEAGKLSALKQKLFGIPLKSLRLDGKIGNQAANKAVSLLNELPSDPLTFASLDVAIAHTRWATHGKVNRENAHPHIDEKQTLALVHNGIIENFAQLKEELQEKGVLFQSETDTEVIVQWIAHLYRGDLLSAVSQTVAKLKGNFAFALIHKNHPDQIIAATRECPLSIATNDSQTESILSSDPNAFVGSNYNLLFLQKEEIARMTKGKVEVFNLQLEAISKKTERLESHFKAPSKEGFEHFLLKEISEQAATLRNTFQQIRLDSLPLDLKAVRRIWILGCGTAANAGNLGSLLFEEIARIPSSCDIASEARYRIPIQSPDTLVIAISQSGETADTLAAVREAKAHGCKILALCNVRNSALTREADGVIYLQAGPEISVCSTKAFSSMVGALILLALHLAKAKGIQNPKMEEIERELSQIPSQIQQVVDDAPAILEIAKKYSRYEDFFFMGRSLMFPTCLEASLKLKEISYVNANGYPAGELKHGPIALLDPHFPVVAFCANHRSQEKIISNLMEVKARGAPLLVLAPTSLKEVASIADDVIWLSPTLDELSPFASSVAGQLLAYYIAKERGCEIDQPRNLAKSVTVE